MCLKLKIDRIERNSSIVFFVHEQNTNNEPFRLRAILNVGTESYTLYDDENRIYDFAENPINLECLKIGDILTVISTIAEPK